MCPRDACYMTHNFEIYNYYLLYYNLQQRCFTCIFSEIWYY